MAITKSAKKAIRGSERKRVFNLRRTRTMRETMKEVRTLATKGSEEVGALLSKAYQAIDKAAKRGVIKKNTAARKKSRLALFVAKVAEK
jgi:small subunit ribosomal protein S20